MQRMQIIFLIVVTVDMDVVMGAGDDCTQIIQANCPPAAAKTVSPKSAAPAPAPAKPAAVALPPAAAVTAPAQGAGPLDRER